jgi:hypothetical protein
VRISPCARSQSEYISAIKALGIILFILLSSTFGMVNTEEGSRIEEKVWDEVASVVMKVAPETEPVWKVSK